MNTASIPMHLATIAACILCSYCYIKTACFYWKSRFNPYIYSVIMACIMGTVIWGCTFLDDEILSYLVFAVMEILILRIGTRANNAHALLAAIASTFHTVCVKGIIIGVFAIVLKKNLYQVITVQNLYLAAVMVTSILKISAPLLYTSTKARSNFATLFRSENELESVLMEHGALFIIMLFFSYNYYYNLDLIWFTIAQIILSVLMLVLYYLTLYYGVRISNLLENDIANMRIQQQLNDKLAQYDSYQNIFEMIEDFKYYFRENMLVTEALIANGSMEEAQSRLHAAIPLLMEKLPSRKVFSNNEGLNALLVNWDIHCQTNKIRFEAMVYLPDVFERKEKEILSVLAIIEDMYSYITRYSKSPFIKVEGKMLQGNFVLNIVGSIQGTVEQRFDLPCFITPNGDRIKMLYQKLSSMSETINGLLFWNYLLKERSFQIIFSIHQ